MGRRIIGRLGGVGVGVRVWIGGEGERGGGEREVGVWLFVVVFVEGGVVEAFEVGVGEGGGEREVVGEEREEGEEGEEEGRGGERGVSPSHDCCCR